MESKNSIFITQLSLAKFGYSLFPEQERRQKLTGIQQIQRFSEEASVHLSKYANPFQTHSTFREVNFIPGLTLFFFWNNSQLLIFIYP